MAIGKAGAYATVEGPKVDFGEIALNAQKIQQADLDRMKDMIPKKEKNDFKINNIEGGFTKTGNGGYDQSMTSLVNKLTERNLLVNKEAEALGRYTPELAAEQQKIQNTLKGLDIVAKKFTEDATVFAKDSKDGKFSSIDKSRFEIFEDIAQKRNLEVEEDEDGDVLFRVRATDPSGKYLSDTEGNPIYKKFNDRGVERDSITKYELENGSLFGNTIKELDRTKTIGEIQNNLKLRTVTKDSNGTLTQTKTFLTDDDYGYVDNAINGVLSNYDNLSSYLYSLDREKYSTPKTIEQYKKDGDLEFASKEMRKGILAGLGFQDKEDRVKPAVTNVNVGGDTGKGLFIFEANNKPRYEVGKVGGKRTGGYQIGLTTLSGKAMAQGMDRPVIMGKTAEGNRYIELALSGGEGESGKTGSGVSSSTKQSSKGGASGRIYLTGTGKVGDQEADVARAEQYLQYIRYKGKQVDSVEQLINIIDGAGGSNKTTKSDFNSKWAKLKSGQSLVGPNGVTYTKK
jgi:hypothetical protein